MVLLSAAGFYICRQALGASHFDPIQTPWSSKAPPNDGERVMPREAGPPATADKEKKAFAGAAWREELSANAMNYRTNRT